MMKIQMNRKLFRRKKKKIINKTVKKIRMMNRFMMKMKSIYYKFIKRRRLID